MKESVWGYWIVILGIAVGSIMMVVQNYTTTSEQDYYMLKSVLESSMYDAIDYGYYRATDKIKMNKEKFVENFIRRFASSVNITKDYQINFYKIYEYPPVASVAIITNDSSDEDTVTNRLTGILFTDISKTASSSPAFVNSTVAATTTTTKQYIIDTTAGSATSDITVNNNGVANSLAIPTYTEPSLNGTDISSIHSYTTKEIIYDGTGKKLTTNGTVSGGTMYYGYSTTYNSLPTRWYTSPVKLTSTGTYYVWYKIDGNATHTDIPAKCLGVVKIVRNTITYSIKNGKATYNGRSTSGGAFVTVPSLSFNIKYTYNGTTYTSMPTFTNAGTYTVTFKITASGYTDAKDSLTIVINKDTIRAETTPTLIANTSMTSESDYKNLLSVKGKIKGDLGTYKYAITTDANASASSLTFKKTPKATVPGTYYVWAKGIPNDESNYNGISPYKIGTVVVSQGYTTTTTTTTAATYHCYLAQSDGKYYWWSESQANSNGPSYHPQNQTNITSKSACEGMNTTKATTASTTKKATTTTTSSYHCYKDRYGTYHWWTSAEAGRNYSSYPSIQSSIKTKKDCEGKN